MAYPLCKICEEEPHCDEVLDKKTPSIHPCCCFRCTNVICGWCGQVQADKATIDCVNCGHDVETVLE